MAKYRITAPDGGTYEVTAPDGASEKDVLAYAQQQFGKPKDYKSMAKPEPVDPTEGMSGFDRFAAGIGKAMSDTGLGLKQVASYVVPGMDPAKVTQDVIEARQRDKPLMDTGAGFAGNLAGNVGIALAPGGALKAAGTAAAAIPATARVAQALNAAGGTLLAPQSIPAALAVGGGMGLVQPAENAGERVTNALLGAVATAAVPVGTRVVKGAKAALEPFYEGGRDQIIGRALKKAAGGEADAAMTAMANARELVPGSAPTAAQASGNAGIAAMERAAEAAIPEATAPYAARRAVQNSARVAVLEDMAGTAESRAAAEGARTTETKALRDAALKNANYGTQKTAELEGRIAQKGDSIVSALRDEGRFSTLASQQENLANKWTPVPGLPRVPGRLAENIERVPAAREAAGDVAGIVAQRKAERAFLERQLSALGESGYSPLNAQQITSNLDSVLKTPGLRASDVVTKSVGELRDKIASLASKSGTLDARDLYTVRKEIGNTISKHAKESANWDTKLAAGLERDLQKSIDAAIEKAGAGDLWTRYLSRYSELSKPINQMDVAREIADKSIDKITGQIKPGALGRAISDDTAARATGFGKATLENTMSPEQLAKLQGLREDVARAVFAQNAGRSVGSDTVQKLAYTNILDQAGVPTFIREFAPTQMLGNFGQQVGKTIYSQASKDIGQKLAEGLLDPKKAAQMMQSATPSERAAVVQALIARTAAPVGMASPALLNANQ